MEDNKENKIKKVNYNMLLLITLVTGVLLILSTYAWFYSSLDVKIDFFNMIVSDESGLFISLDGKNYSNSVEISKDILIDQVKKEYSNHTNQWAGGGLYAVSSNGIKNSNKDKFDIFGSSRIDYRIEHNKNERLLQADLVQQDKPYSVNQFVAFDLFLKNVSGSPNSDNLYLVNGTSINVAEENYDDSDGTINSIRMGFVKIGSVSSKSDIETIQNVTCNNKCEHIIYEPNSIFHSEESIERATHQKIKLVDGEYKPTYAVINSGNKLQVTNGHEESGTPLDKEHFALQKTITSFKKPIFTIPNGITKFRVYVWIEGQDVDSLETKPVGATITISIKFYKDLAGYN